MSFVLILTLLAAQSAPALVEDWEWDTTTPICTLRQTTPSTEIIEVSRTPGNEETEVKITVGMRRGFPVGRLKQGTLTLYPAGKASADGFFRSHNKKLVSYAVTSDPTFIGRFSDASAIGLSSDEVEQLRVTVRSAAAATEALRACEDRKMRAGGLIR